ncbi:MAG: alanyl-tRNA editing protein [Deltaproteobacteria bacterium]|nr:alanyl-tRNA editing protein [Deltaproteobacteria bacterium]
MTATSRAYFDDVLLDELESTVLAHATHAGRPSLVLDRTVFYPEAGGQMADRGTLGGHVVIDVQVDDEGRVHHVLEGALPPIDAPVRGVIDRPRRRVHMALHTGQHMLSRALVDVCGAETVSSRLGEQTCTIDVDRDGLAASGIAACESLVNRVIDEDRGVRAWFPHPDELASLALRRAPKQTENVRVVDVSGFDVSPCGGTHVTHTAQIGLLRITGTERYKGGTRLTFTAGPRARAMLFDEDRVVRELARELVCAPEDVGAGLARVRGETTAAREELGRVRAILTRALVDEARRSAEEDQVILVLPEGGIELAKAVAAGLTREGSLTVVIAARIEEGLHTLVARGPGSSRDARAILAAIAAACGGRGGGRPERAEGRMPADAELVSIAKTALAGAA